jgi:signal transduction histidine kinase
MTSIRSFSEILRSAEGLSPEDRARYAAIIEEEANRLTRLLDDLLDLSVLENGQVVLDTRVGQLGDLLDRAIAAAGVRDTLRIQRDETREAITLDTDLDRLTQVFINVIANAGKYCEADSPMLTIRAEEQDGALIVDFVDNGFGIPSDRQAVIFEKFARIGETKAGGAGLGLAICKEIMARLGGDITYLRDQPGTAFRVRLPRVAGQALQAAQ